MDFAFLFKGYGSIACPLSLIRGKRSARLQQQTISEERAEIQNQIRALKNRVRFHLFVFHASMDVVDYLFKYPRHVPMSIRDKEHLTELEQKDVALFRNEESIIVVRNSLYFKCRYIYRPVQMVVGGLLSVLALLIFISLLLSNINKCLHFVDFKQIFAQGNQTLPNPIDLVLTWTGKVSRNKILKFQHLHGLDFSVLSYQLHSTLSISCLHHFYVLIRLATDWNLVSLDSSSLSIDCQSS